MHPGDLVVFAQDPLFYGVMRVNLRTTDGRLLCGPAHPAVPVYRRRLEVFFRNELAPYSGVLVDVQRAAAALEELDTQRAQDADRDAAAEDDTTGETGGEGMGSE